MKIKFSKLILNCLIFTDWLQESRKLRKIQTFVQTKLPSFTNVPYCLEFIGISLLSYLNKVNPTIKIN
jgi:hypothetical protein